MPESFYIILSKSCVCHCGLNALGHEIHVSRFILFDLLQKNLIDSNSTIVSVYKDRFFLYDRYFKNIITYDDYQKNKKMNIDEMDLTQYSNEFKTDQIEIFKKINYHYNQFEKTPFVMTCLNNIDIADSTNNDAFKNKFVLIHTRTRISGGENKNLYSLLKTIDKIKSTKNTTVVVFSTDNLNIHMKNVYFINNLHLYCKLLNNKNCELFISEWSGGGQLSQYFYSGKIIYYFDNYPSNDYEKDYSNLQNHANQCNNIMNAWDFKTTTDCERSYYKTLDEMLETLNKYI